MVPDHTNFPIIIESGPLDFSVVPIWRQKKTSSSSETESDTERQPRTKIAAGVTTGTLGTATAAARKAGVDRHAESGLAEKMHAKAYARRVGGSVIKDQSSVFTPDGGIDKIVTTNTGEKSIQSKHYGTKLGEATVKDYQSNVDVIASTRGFGENVDLSKCSCETITYDDWSLPMKTALEVDRIKRGVQIGLLQLKRGTCNLTRQIVYRSKDVGIRLLCEAKVLKRVGARIGKSAFSWLARQPVGGQVLFVITLLGGPFWLMWRRWKGEYTHYDVLKWLGTACFVLIISSIFRRIRR